MQESGSPGEGWSSAEAVTVQPPALDDGWSAHRRRVRRRGPWRGLVLPAVAGGAALLALWGSTVWWRGTAGLLLSIGAAPLLPLAGVPATTDTARVVAGVGASAVVWLGLGALAAHRATRVPGASWPEWAREFRRLAAGFVVGGWLALAVATAVVALRAA